MESMARTREIARQGISRALLGSALVIVATACTASSGSGVISPDAGSLPSTTELGPIVSDAESTSTLPLMDTESVIALSFDALMARRIACGFRPRDCDVSALAIGGSPLFERLTALMKQRITAGITASRRGSLRYRIDDVEMIDAKTAAVTSCLTDDTVLMSSGAIFDDSQFSAITRWSMQRDESGWLWFEDHVVDWKRGVDLCAFED